MRVKLLNTIDEIKCAVDAGLSVYSDTTGYPVIKDSIGQYLITTTFNDYCVGLHGMEGTKYASQLNGTAFFTTE